MNTILLSKFLLFRVSSFFIDSSSSNKFLILLIPVYFLFYLIFFFKYSYIIKSSNLLDMGSYEVPLVNNNKSSFKNIIWYILKFQNDTLLFLFSILNELNVKSIETLHRNAKWLEREVTDFFNILFTNKRDRRSLFTIPILYESPFKKKFPCIGFYELFICFFTKKIIFKHISLKS